MPTTRKPPSRSTLGKQSPSKPRKMKKASELGAPTYYTGDQKPSVGRPGPGDNQD